MLAKVSRINHFPKLSELVHCVTSPQNEYVSHRTPRDNVFPMGLLWDTMAKKGEYVRSTGPYC